MPVYSYKLWYNQSTHHLPIVTMPIAISPSTVKAAAESGLPASQNKKRKIICFSGKTTFTDF